jgi:hypothetical protein
MTDYFYCHVCTEVLNCQDIIEKQCTTCLKTICEDCFVTHNKTKCGPCVKIRSLNIILNCERDRMEGRINELESKNMLLENEKQKFELLAKQYQIVINNFKKQDNYIDELLGKITELIEDADNERNKFPCWLNACL